MNPDADPKLEALFAEPMRAVSDDARALATLLTHLERTDRRRGAILTAAGVLGAGLAAVVVALTGALPVSLAALSDIAGRTIAAVSQWSLPASSLPEGSVAMGLGIVALAAAAAFVSRTRT